MDKKNIIIILLIMGVIIFGIGILFTSGLLQSADTMKTIQLSDTCAINVTKSDTNITLYADTIKLYNDTKNGIQIISYNSQEAFDGTGNALGGAFAYASLRDALTVGENIGELNGFLLYKCNGYYSAKLVDNVTHDNIVVVCKDLDLLKKIVSSAKFTKNTYETNNTANVNSNTHTKNSTTKNNASSADSHTKSNDNNGNNHNNYYPTSDFTPAPAGGGSDSGGGVNGTIT